MKTKEYVFSNGDFDFYASVKFEIHTDNNGNSLALPDYLDLEVSLRLNGTVIDISNERFRGDEMMMLWKWSKEKVSQTKKMMRYENN